MASGWRNKMYKAQGMVEFALVLPILLLIILGIIGFGHLFFVYSSVVSSSREAARFGSAVGVTGSGIPRYQDCNAIRTSAVNLGRMAGVDPASVTIQYDKGPGTALMGVDCSGATGPEVELGDRIIVTITIQYNSIVPIVNIPDFPLTATTRRTIVRSLQIGQAPTAEPVCPTTDVFLTIMGEDSAVHTTHSVVGQPVVLGVAVAAASPPHPSTDESLYLFDTTIPSDPEFPQQVFDAPSGSYTHTFWEAGDYRISGTYVGDILQCFDDSSIAPQLHVVDAADTVLQFLTPLDDANYTVDEPVMITVSIGTLNPGSRLTWEGVEVDVVDRNDPAYACTATLDAAGNGTCSIVFDTPGPVAIDASFVGDTNYKLSIASVDINIVEVVPTMITPIIITPTVTPVVGCPTYSNFQPNYSGNGQSFALDITNNSSKDIYFYQLVLRWPNDPIAQLQKVALGSTNLYLDELVGTNPKIFSLGNGGASGKFGKMDSKATQTLSFKFSQDMTNVKGDYSVNMLFSNDCTLEYKFSR